MNRYIYKKREMIKSTYSYTSRQFLIITSLSLNWFSIHHIFKLLMKVNNNGESGDDGGCVVVVVIVVVGVVGVVVVVEYLAYK